jgi:hypothetical protein
MMAVEVRRLGQTGIEDYHAHLVRLDRTSRFPGLDDRAIDAHCLSLLASRAILIGLYVDGVMRAGAQIVPDRTARRAEAAITAEPDFQDRGYDQDLSEAILAEARRYRLADLRVLQQGATTDHHVSAPDRRAVNG